VGGPRMDDQRIDRESGEMLAAVFFIIRTQWILLFVAIILAVLIAVNVKRKK
jgi:hypothetical protein